MKTLYLFRLLCLLLPLGCSAPASRETEKEVPIANSRNDLPQMTVTTLAQSKIDLHKLQGNTILILFQPDCDHCQREALEIRKHLDRFNQYVIYFISAAEMPSIEAFGTSYDLIGHSNVNFAATTVENVIRSFGPIPAPSIYIYNDQKLKKKFNGEIGIEAILQAI
jgi:thiol-disulfide isomerase/thioredoxin